MPKQVGKQIGIRLTPEEMQRLQPLVAKAERKSYNYAPVSEILKELIGLKPHKLTTESDRKALLEEMPKLK